MSSTIDVKFRNLTIRLELNDVFIVDFLGIKSSLQQGRWISEAPFEIRGDLSLGRFPIFKDRLRYRIFDGLNLLFYGSIDFPHPTKQELKDLVRLGGGNPIEYEILSDPKSPPCLENSDYIRNVENGGRVSGSVCIVSPDITDSCLQDVYGSFAINQNPHLFCVSLVWLIDSISVYRIVNPKLYRILPPN